MGLSPTHPQGKGVSKYFFIFDAENKYSPKFIDQMFKYNCFISLLFALLLSSSSLWAQEKQTLSHDDYDKWEIISGTKIAPDGNHLLYMLNPQRQDGNLIINRTDGSAEQRIARGSKAAFSAGSNFAVFHIEPQREVVRQAKVDKKKKDEMPKDSLGILILSSGELLTYADVISYQLPKEPSPWLAFTLDFSRIVEETEEDSGTNPTDTVPEPLREEQPEEEKEPETEKIKQLIIKNPLEGIAHVYDDVEHYRMAENGTSVLFIQEVESEEDSLEIRKLFAFNTTRQSLQLLDSAAGDFKQLSVSKNGENFAWLFSADTTDVKVYDLFVHQTGRRARTQSVTPDTENMPEDFAVSEYNQPEFSDDNSKVFFGIAPRPEEEPKDTLLEEEKYSLDIWHWQDPLLQSQQKVTASREKQRNFEAVFHLRKGNLVPLASEDMPVITKDRYGNAPFVMGISGVPYQRESTWLGSTPRDVYVVDVNDGSRKQILTRAEANVQFSVHGNYILYYLPEEKNWYAYSIKDETARRLTSDINVPLYDELNDVPNFARPHGTAGWGEDDDFVLVYDRYDIWKLDPSGKRQPENITGGYGRSNHILFRYQNLDRDEHHIPDDKIWLSAFHEESKQGGYYSLNMKTGNLERLIMEDAAFMQLQKAKEEDLFAWRRSTFTQYPDLYTSNTDFTEVEKISSANPWQDEYLWGSVELVEWQDFNNDTLQGLLYRPENFDPEKKYPMIVYFYERSSQNLHRHNIPSPSRSIINPAFCTSNGYVVFVPDITYRIGYPGQSAYNAIISGTQTMLERHSFIDRERMGLQGQSWGGYQIAYLITKTNMFRAAMAGAPVSNMISAYGGIRWGSGMSRQFQYELTQSRIGGTLWEKPMHYVENSPVFFAPDIETPLLMMHNDDDGAVPWYQGIEMYTAMRRLNKPVWLLVYNKEDHNLMKWPARMDLSVRMYQFFDHYLKDQPAPRWMEKGIPYIEKDTTHGYELMNKQE